MEATVGVLAIDFDTDPIGLGCLLCPARIFKRKADLTPHSRPQSRLLLEIGELVAQ
jgi:hypothetical protein